MGMHVTTDPNTRVGFLVMNCQLCHAERLRLPAGDRLVPGLGSTHVLPHGYDAALVQLARDPAFTTENVLVLANRAARAHDLTWPEGTRVPIVRATVTALRERAEARGLDVERLASGLPGRVATIESFAMSLHVHPAVGTTVGWAKVPDVRGFPWRDTLSWDGVGTGSPVALAAEADFAFGARPEWFETHRHIATDLYLFLKHFDRELPYPGRLDVGLAERGHSVFDATCARCHGFYAAQGPQPRVRYKERVVPAAMVGTDESRMEAVTPAFIEAARAVPLARGLTTVAPTGGYVPPVLLDVWARGVYGHIGQWPSIGVMAMKPDERPRRFAIDPDAPYDLEQLGLHWKRLGNGEPPPATGYVYDGGAPGYGVLGHRFLCDLPQDDRRAVLEYLKTL
jgi:mono/diheme cytochrome c family protein